MKLLILVVERFMVDDFCVKTEDLWRSVGAGLLHNIKQQARKK